MEKQVGLLHPGQMGTSIAATMRNSGFDVFWVPKGRSAATRQRAESQDLHALPDLATLCRTCSYIVSICPPHAAESVAGSVIKQGFRGHYLDANAISPHRSLQIKKKMVANGIEFIDGGIIGGPAWKPGTTWLYLSGERADDVLPLFSSGPLEVEVMDGEVGAASALKMCFAAYTKGTTALICTILAVAEKQGVRETLEKQWSRGGSDFARQAHQRTRQVTKKAWRFEGEMREIAATFANANMPEGFHQAAAEIFSRIGHFKDNQDIPELSRVLQALLDKD